MWKKVTRTDFEWVYTDEPHASQKYPEIKSLMGSDPMLKYTALALMIVQFISCFVIRDLPWPYVVVLAYFIGGTINHSLTLAIHEISHNLAFGHVKPWKNRIFEIFVNLPIIIPYSAAFKKYHMDHHRYQGDDLLDVDIPCYLEAKLFDRTATKAIWLLFQPFFYALRPVITRPKPITPLEWINLFVQLSFDIGIYVWFGPKVLFYLLGGSLLSMGIHPVAGHFISEHYMFAKGYETYSYYGPLNWITFNVGYHMEHHDFPSVPGSKLPKGDLQEKLKLYGQKVKEIAKEYYDNLPCHTSWCKVLYDFVFDPDIGPYARVRRPTVLNKKTTTNNVKFCEQPITQNGDLEYFLPSSLVQPDTKEISNGINVDENDLKLTTLTQARVEKIAKNLEIQKTENGHVKNYSKSDDIKNLSNEHLDKLVTLTKENIETIAKYVNVLPHEKNKID